MVRVVWWLQRFAWPLVSVFCWVMACLIASPAHAQSVPSDGLPGVSQAQFKYQSIYGPATAQAVCDQIAAGDNVNATTGQVYSATAVMTSATSAYCDESYTYHGNTSESGQRGLTYIGQQTTCAGVSDSTLTSNPSVLSVAPFCSSTPIRPSAPAGISLSARCRLRMSTS